MRIRSIKPEFWVSESVGRLSREARLLFIGLWSFAEDSGRGRGAFPAISGALFPYDQDAVRLIPRWFAELEKEGMVRRYQADDGNTYYDMPNWLRHQKIEKPSKPRIPEFREGSPNTPRILPEISGEEPGTGSREPVAGNCENLASQPNLPMAVEAPASEPRKRNLIFDAACRADGANPSELTKIQAGRIAKAAADIKHAMGGMTPEELASEIDARAEKYKAINPWKKLTAMALAAEWGSLSGESHTTAPITNEERKRLAAIDSDLHSFRRQTAPDPDQIAHRTREIARLEAERAALLKGRTP